ncbi:LysM peptidoglycan-binding domain-containing protein [Enterococcus faecalis]|uniref:LysM peptidoglycan-binding domain-containing protein n=1 Tax=Enterococcus faecalis TaxID=1351 RepID=UPI001A0B96F0|nr:LysM peptidoglycan-binding domain-containing protein [Enterococcus faecalis]EGO2635172.1 LysM peptidoglycan-binding domain-containing protein [Enterococcus faecalis]EGO5090928.1 LysM peptidoglycan-binding domain-containing protein [Enterococcus faecalis]EGO6785252.1 LysM peptidoglycan-binding domain-containing protein [Enterococcus faecalis]EGO8198791.1 LysM peptidoglycan-binding domain-containing protein [Enterococcus faecalis]EJC3731911.1 LysM peptidoglycan-binding domain-containing prote
MKKIVTLIIVALTAVTPLNVFAAKGDQGVDWAIYQGEEGRFGYAHDKFTIAQIGGYNASGIYEQYTYKSQVASAIAQGKRAHTYIWYDTWGNMDIAKTTMDYFLPRIQTPKNSIVALDFEHGASSDVNANTETILYGMRRIKQAGYTPMYYSYKPFTLQYVDYQRIIKEFPNSLWIAAYPSYEVTPEPLYAYFPSMDGIGIWQFTSTYIAGGLDGNVDLTGITDNGYTATDKPETETPAIDVGEEVENTPSSDVKVGDTVKVKFSVDAWATGEAIPDWVKGNSYKVQEVTGSRVLLEGILSWISKGDIELLPDAATVPDKQPEATHVVQYGETLSSIAYQYGTNYQRLAALNGLANPNLIYPGQVLKVNGSATSNVYTVKYGDNLSSIAAKLGTTYQALAALNGLANPNLIYPGQTLNY